MARKLSLLILTTFVLAAFARDDRPSEDDLKKKPITTAPGPLGNLLRQWHKDGTAAGNVGDWYDNRDGEHSPLDLRPWPQLQKVTYSEDERKRGLHWALQPLVLPHVVFGNSSTSDSPTRSGSNVRTSYCSRGGLDLLQDHYRKNNLYIYPEHRDHDPGRNGTGDGYGDLYPTNTPFLITSQGSSGSDQPFMRAIPFTLAAFRPEVKKKLVETGLLMPTVQMIFRLANRHLDRPAEYLTGKAHPTVFEGVHVDPLRMAQLAHDIRLDSIPPLVRLRIVEEDSPVPGQDYFEPAGLTEKLADTETVVARIWRGKQNTRRLVLSADRSLDVNKKPLTFRWVVLRGDQKRIQVKPRDKDGTSAEIVVAYHERRPIAPGSAMASNRVDIGVFAHNGVHHSPPAFVTFFSLDCEARTHDEKGRIREIGHGMGFTELKVPDFARLFLELSREGPAAKLLGLDADQRKALAEVAKRASTQAEELALAKQKRQGAETARNKASAGLRTAEQALAAARKEKGDTEKAAKEVELARTRHREAVQAHDTLGKQLARVDLAYTQLLNDAHPALKSGARPFVVQRLDRAMKSPTLWSEHRDAFLALAKQPDRAKGQTRVEAARAKLTQLGITVEKPEASAYVQAMIEEFNARLLAELVMPGLLTPVFHANFVDQRLVTPKSWRDVFEYDGDRLTGWKRYHLGAPRRLTEFTPEGWRVLTKDDRGRPTRARTVTYRQAPMKGMGWVNANPLEERAGDEVITLAYEGDRRVIKSRDKVEEVKPRD